MRTLTGSSGVVSNLPLIVIAPGVDLAVAGAGQAVQRATRDVYDFLVMECSQDSLGRALVGVVSMT